MTEDERKEELANMHRCLDAGARVWSFIAKRVDDKAEEATREDIMAEIGLVFPTPLAEHRQKLIMQEIATVINEYDLTSCGLWNLAHILLHLIFDEDVPRH